ncbi:MAG: methyltransferase domain-containing protein [Candidatus Krumholzibacteriaceae bacterium]|jgi:ubiquinone/menaquinone biosynthesis C-methylase UbiE
MSNGSGPSHIAAGKPAERDDFILIRRRRLVRDLAPPTGAVMLDLGCGNGAQTILFGDDFPRIIGVDLGVHYLKEMMREVERRGLAGRMLPVCSDSSRLPLSDASIDFAISFEVLEHVRREEETLSELARVMRPGGVVALSVPNRWWIFETHGANLPLLPWNRVPLFSWLPKGIHDRWARARIYTKREIVEKLGNAGFSVRRVVYISAPMDVVKWKPLRRVLRATIFRPDEAPLPTLATAILAVAERNA